MKAENPIPSHSFIGKAYFLLIVIFIAGLGLLGWYFSAIFFIAGSSQYIPIAPSTALTFIVLCAVAFTTIYIDTPHVLHSIATIILIAITLLCLEVFFDYWFYFPWDIEKMFIRNPEFMGTLPKGRMSPITALLFILSCLGIFGMRRDNATLIKYFGGGFSFLVFTVSSILLLGYIVNSPLLYGGHIIPVALPTAFCFILLSTTLLWDYELKFWTFNLVNDNPITRRLLKTFLPIVIFIIILQGFLTTHFSMNQGNPVLSASIILVVVIAVTGIAVMRVSSNMGKNILSIERELAKTKDDLEQFFNLVPDLVAFASTDGYFIKLNPEWEKKLGYTIEELMSNPLETFIHPDDIEATRGEIKRQLNGSQTLRFENRYRHKDGSYIWLEWNATASKNDVLYAAARDVTERKLMTSELVHARDRAEESDRLKSAFLANMSHEIRTPMNGILGFAALLDEPEVTGEEQKKYIKIIQKSGNRLLNIINDIVDMAKIEAGQMETTVSRVALNDKLEYVCTFFTPEADRNGLKISYEAGLPSEQAIIESDPDKILAILINLVNNAIKFTKNGFIKFGYRKRENWIEFFVQDTGKGISESQLTIIFERFKQGDKLSTKNYEGTGLGLSISKAYAEMLGGKIWVESQPGKGTVFYFTVPFKTGGDDRGVV